MLQKIVMGQSKRLLQKQIKKILVVPPQLIIETTIGAPQSE